MNKKKKTALTIIIVVLTIIVASVVALIMTGKIGNLPINAQSISQAYEIAVENGYEGSEEEFKEAVTQNADNSNESGKKYSGIASVESDKNGNSIVRLDNGTKIKIVFSQERASNVSEAYEIAVKNGYDGTQEEWEDAIKNSDSDKDEKIANIEKDNAGKTTVELENGTIITIEDSTKAEGENGSTSIKTSSPQGSDVYYTVTFEDENGTALKTEKVKEGSSAVAPDAPYKEGYAFSKWNKDFSRVTANLTIKPVFEKIVKPAVVLQTVYARKGSNTVKVNVNLLNNPGIASIVADISFDKGLKLVDVEFNKSELKKCMLTTPEPFANPQRLSILNTNANFNYSGTIATLTFQLDNKLQSEDSREIRITYKQGNIFDINMKNIKFETVNGKIIIK